MKHLYFKKTLSILFIVSLLLSITGCNYKDSSLAYSEFITDTHIVLKPNIEKLNELYHPLITRVGDMHAHSLYSDGNKKVEELVAQLQDKGYDFIALSDHNTYYQCYDDSLKPENFLPALEYTTRYGDLNIYFDHADALKEVGNFTFEKILFSLDDLKKEQVYDQCYGQQTMIFKGLNEFNISYNTPFYSEFIQFIKDKGGVIQPNHPSAKKFSRKLLDGEKVLSENWDMGQTHMEIINGSMESANDPGRASYYSVLAWQELLAMGKKIYGTAGTDTHGNLTGKAASHLYCKSNSQKDTFDALNSGNSSFGSSKGPKIKLCIDDVMMGGTVKINNKSTLKIKLDNLPANPVVIKVWTDKGIAYYNKITQDNNTLELRVQNRLFYRVEIKDENDNEYLAFSNPIFIE